MSAPVELTLDTLKQHSLPPIASGDKDDRGSILLIAGSREVAGVSVNDLTDPELLDVSGNAALNGVPVAVTAC